MTLTLDRKTELLSAARLFDGVDAAGMDRIAAVAVAGRLPRRPRDRPAGRDRDGVLHRRQRRRAGRPRRRDDRRRSAPATSSASCRSSTASRATPRSSRPVRRPAWRWRRGTSRPSCSTEPRVALAILRGLATRLRDLTEAGRSTDARRPRTDDRAATPTPGGTVTFLFTDIEGSTQLEQRLGTERYAAVLERHRALLREAWQAQRRGRAGHRGRFVLRDVRPGDGGARGGDRRRSVRCTPSPGRMASTSGSGWASTPGSPSGSSRGGAAAAAWSASTSTRRHASRRSAHGGQILMSDATRGLLTTHLPDDVHAARPRRVPAQGPARAGPPGPGRSSTGCPSEFPAPRTPDAHPNNLPTQLTTFVGRDAELAEAAALLGTTRLLTLTGPGGTGKTRLSLQLAARVSDDFPDGVFFVPLEPIRDPMLVAPRIAAAVGVSEGSARPIADTLADWLRDKDRPARARQLRAGRRRGTDRGRPAAGGAGGSRSSSPAGRPSTCPASRSTRSPACPPRPIPAS